MIMKLKKGISFPEFLQQVKQCKDEVYFETTEGDSLNLKSVLSSYIFITLMLEPDLIEDGSIRCKNKNDYLLLNDFLHS